MCLFLKKILTQLIFQTKTPYGSPFYYFQYCQDSITVSNTEILNTFGNDTIRKDSIYSFERFPLKGKTIAVFSAIILRSLRQISFLIQRFFRHLIFYGLWANFKTSFFQVTGIKLILWVGIIFKIIMDTSKPRSPSY